MVSHACEVERGRKGSLVRFLFWVVLGHACYFHWVCICVLGARLYNTRVADDDFVDSREATVLSEVVVLVPNLTAST